MSNQIERISFDVMQLAELAIGASAFDVQLSVVASTLGKKLPRDCGYRSLVRSNVVPNPKENMSHEAIRASHVVTIMQWLIAKKVWLDHIPFFDAFQSCHVIDLSDLANYNKWLERYSTFIENHRHEPLVSVTVQVPEQESSSESRPMIPTYPSRRGRVRGPLIGSFKPYARGETTDHGLPSRMTQDRLIEYYTGASEVAEAVSEFKSSPDEVEAMWSAIYTGAEITDLGDKKLLRTLVLVYTMHNGCSPNMYTTRTFELSEDKKVPLLSIFSFFSNCAGTFRRFMRGMADEAVAYMLANTNFHPHWGVRNMGADYERLLGFDYADGRSDLTPLEHSRIRALLGRILDRQAEGYQRQSQLPPTTGPVSGPVHSRQSRSSVRSLPQFEDRNLID